VHFVENPETIPQIINAEVRSKDDLAIQERPVRAVRVRPVEFIDGIDFARSPRLLGFVQGGSEGRFGNDSARGCRQAAPGALALRFGPRDCLMSDAKSRWAAPWVRWTSFGTLWPQNGARRFPPRPHRACRRSSGTSEGEAVVYYDVLGDADNPTAALRASGPPHILVTAPGEASRTIPLEETSPGHYEAHIPAGQGGLYRIVSGSSELILPEAGF